jgi:DNA anti-recombination protein RmuC
MFPPKVTNPTIKDLNDSKVDEITTKEHTHTHTKKMIRMINELKEDMYKYLNEVKENIKKQLNELRKNSSKQLNEIRKIMQDMEEFNEDLKF